MSRLILPGQKPIIGIADEIKHALIAWHGSNPYTNLANHPGLGYESGGNAWRNTSPIGDVVRAPSHSNSDILRFGTINPVSHGYTQGISIFTEVIKQYSVGSVQFPSIVYINPQPSRSGFCMLSFEHNETPNDDIIARLGGSISIINLFDGSNGVGKVKLSVGDRVRAGIHFDVVKGVATTFFKVNDAPTRIHSRVHSVSISNVLCHVTVAGDFRGEYNSSSKWGIRSVVVAPSTSGGDALRVFDWVENPDQLWVTGKSLYIPQQTEGVATLSGNNVSQSNKSTQGQISQSNSLIGGNTKQGNKSTEDSISSQNDLIGVDVYQANESTQGQITSAAGLSGDNVEQSNKSTGGSVSRLNDLAGSSVTQVNKSTAGSTLDKGAVSFGDTNASRRYESSGFDLPDLEGDFTFIWLARSFPGPFHKIVFDSRADGAIPNAISLRNFGGGTNNNTIIATTDAGNRQSTVSQENRFYVNFFRRVGTQITAGQMGLDEDDVISVSDSGTMAAPIVLDTPFYLGDRLSSDSSRFFRGSIAWFAVLDKWLTNQDIIDIASGETYLLPTHSENLLDALVLDEYAESFNGLRGTVTITRNTDIGWPGELEPSPFGIGDDALTGASVKQGNKSTGGQIITLANLSAVDIVQGNKSTQGPIAGEGYLLGSSVDQVNKSTGGPVSTEHTLAGSDVAQVNKSTQGSVSSTGSMAGENCRQSNRSTAGSISVDSILSGNNVISINKSQSGQISQSAISLSGESVEQPNKSTQGTVSESMLLHGANVIQGNFSSQGRVIMILCLFEVAGLRIDDCTQRKVIRRGDSFRMSFIALEDNEPVDLTGYTITAWSSTPGGRCIGEVEIENFVPADGSFDLVCQDTTAWTSSTIKIVVRAEDPAGNLESTEDITIDMIAGGCLA